MNLDEADARRRFASARRAYLATVTREGQPHLVPVTFALRHDALGDIVVIAVDSKPKRSSDLKRLRNITANPRVCLLVDEYHDTEWRRLWWVRADGQARILTEDSARAEPLRWLREKYPQYRREPPPGPVIWVEVRAWRGWAYSA